MKAIQFFKLTLLSFLLLGLLSHEVNADTTYQNSWLEASLDPCTGRYTLRFVFGVDEDCTACTNDEWDSGSTLEYKVGSGSWTTLGTFNSLCLPIFPNIYGCNFFTFDGTDFVYTENAFAQSVSDNGNETEPNGNVLNWARVRFDSPESFVGEDVQFRLNGTWEGENVDVSKTVDAPVLAPVTGFSATDASLCAGVNLTWDIPDASDLCTDSDDQLSKYYIYRQAAGSSQVFLASYNYFINSHLDLFAVPGVVYTYIIKHVIEGPAGGEYESSTSQDQGSRKTVPNAPVNLQASDNNCNSTVNLTWNFQSGLDSIEVFLDGTRIAKLTGGVANYTATVPQRGVFYAFTLRAKNNCGWGVQSTSVPGVSPADPEKSPDLTLTEVPGIGIQLDWVDVALETGYRIERNLLGGGGSTFIDRPANETSYVDESVLICQTYQYRIISINNCKPDGVAADTVRNIILNPDLSNSFSETSLKGSKGFFSNRVELNWSLENNENFINGYNIYRKQLGTIEDSILIASVNSGSNIYIDNFTDAGVLYEYFVIGENQCETTTQYTNVAGDIGFRSPFGTVTGNVSYTGAGSFAVEGVRISAESTSQINGTGIELNGDDSLTIQSSASLSFTDALLFETWLRPENLSGNFSLAKKDGVFNIDYEAGSQSFVFETMHSDATISTLTSDGGSLIESNFIHVAFQYANDSLYAYLNGQPISAVESNSTEDLNTSATPITIGGGYNGVIDETRIWNNSKSNLAIAQDHSRIMVGGEAGLKVYLNYNEGAGNAAYDISRLGNTFNRNHAQFQGTPSWSETIPSDSQLSIAAYTNANGNYVMTVPYNGLGEGFVLTPSYLIHQFDPGTRALFIGDGQIIHNNIDFEDISSFEVTGSVFYQNTSCPAAGVFLSVDGSQVVADGLPVTTDNGGTFTILVPIGEHFISVSKPGHVFSLGRFPETGRYDFQADSDLEPFLDSTLVKVVGRVVGGLREANKPPGLGLSKNNIGQAELQFISQLGSGCAADTVLTDPNTGEYVTYLPPLKYVPSVNVINNPTIDFGVLDLLDLSATPQEFTASDTTFTTDGQVFEIDSVVYNKRLDYIHRVNPIIIVKDRDGVNDFIGDSLYTYNNPNTGDTLIRNLRENPFQWPVFTRQDDDYLYRALIKVFERYVNADNTAWIDSVPSTDGTLFINNELADVESAEIELAEFNTPDSLKFLIYSFKADRPNFEDNTSIPEYSFTRSIEMGVITGSGEIIFWKPIPQSEVPEGGNQNFRAVYLGTKTDGAQFVTTGPQVVEYVLRDPPGSSSFASRETGTVKKNEASWGWNLGTRVHTEDIFFLGSKFNVGVGLSTETDIENNALTGFSATIGGGRSGSQSITTTNTQSWNTNSDGGKPGSGSDLYIGRSMNLQFGVADNLTIIPDSLCDQTECLGQAVPGFQYALIYSLAIKPDGYQTTFIYNQDNIIDEQIPNLIELRNIILQSDPDYTSNLPISDPNYGKNNDDPVFGPLVSTDNPNQGDIEDLTGPSYTYSIDLTPDSIDLVDTVRFINNQVRQWEDAIRRNEWEKINISNPAFRDSLKEAELASLESEYSADLDAYNALIAANGLGAVVIAYGLAATPVPGTAIAGYATFAVTTGTGIAQAELAERFEQYQQAKDRIEEKYDQTELANYSISGGNSFSSGITHETATAVTRSVEYSMTAGLQVVVNAKVNNNGVGYNKGIELNFTSSRDWTDETSESESVSFTLEDPDQTDFFSVDVFPSLLGWGPIFKKQAGGQTSCPYEDEELSLFEEPGTILSDATLQVDKPSLSASPSILANIPITQSAVFNLTLGNGSESDHEREYQVSLVSSSNPFGAIATIDGNSSVNILVPAGSSVNKVLSIAKGPGAVYAYDSLLFVITAPCEGFNLSDSVYVSARFIPACTDIELVAPEEAWVANTFNDDTIPAAIAGYDINFFDFEELRVEYKPSNESQWIGLQTFYRDTSGLGDADAIPIPTDQSFTLYDWDIAQLTDGYYDLRTRSICTLADKTSVTYSGIIDRIKPEAFGTPSPGDGILSPNDDISITFNEEVDLGSLTILNFDVRGVLNGTETIHPTSLFFDGVNDYLEVTAGVPLKNRDFTIQLALRKETSGAGTLIALGQNEAEELYLGFNEANQLVFRINGEEITSAFSFETDEWYYVGLSYSFLNETAEMFVAGTGVNPQVINTGNNSIFPAFEGNGRMLIGKQDYDDPTPFHGNIHELRIWDRALSLNEFSLTDGQILSDHQAGLLFNWRMDELEGTIAEDHVRRRDAEIIGAQWAVYEGGNSASFDGISNYLTVQTGDVLITDDMDFTLEFWFKGTSGASGTLFSNGSGNGQLSDSLNSWVINQNANGSIELLHNGLSFTIADNNYFDGEWHHLALVLNRDANLTSLIDGNIENAIPSQEFRQLTGANMTLGALNYQSITESIVENFYTGQLDEFRFWNTNRKIEQIKRDKQINMAADEPGLLIYLPFEENIPIQGAPNLEATFNEQIDSEIHTVEPNGTVLVEESPLIRIKRPVQSVAFDYSVNDDQIIITPTTSAELIENVTLDITVSNVRDLQGNIMASPVTWIAFIDKNQVVWGEDLLSFEKAVGEELSFSSTIVNQGGAEKAFSIQNLPSWLSANPSSGSISPNSNLPVNFTVDPLVNIGDYTQDVHLLTDFNFPEKLSVSMKVRETPPDWDFDPDDFQLSMGIIGILEIRDITSTDTEDILIAEVDGETRGVQTLTYLEDLDRYLVYLNVYSNTAFGDTLRFKIWDASAGILYSRIDPDFILFEANQLIGSPLLPQVFSTDFEIEAEIPLNAGWNWFGHYLQNPDSSNLDALFESLNSVSGDQINGQDNFANYSNSNGWLGPLENTGIRAEEGYKFFKSADDTLILRGDIIDPSSRIINLDEGWNWLGFISIRNQGIDQALGNLNPSEGDQIKGRSSFSIYVNEALGWQGTLNTLVPGQSYMYESGQATSFTFPFAGFFKSGSSEAKEIIHPVWQVDYAAYPTNMSMILTVSDSCAMPENTWIGAFDANGVIRGIAPFSALENMQKAFLTINADQGTQLSLQFIEGESGALYPESAVVNYEANILRGSFNQPEIIDTRGIFCQPNSNGSLANLEVFPTVFSGSLRLIYSSMRADENARIVIYDMHGRSVYNQVISLIEGVNEFYINEDLENLGAGPYLLRLKSGSQAEMKKIIKTK